MRLCLIFLCASLSALAGANTAVFQQFDSTTRGNWKGIYGQGGYIIPNDSNNSPAYSTVTSTGANPYTWVASSTDPRALIKGTSTTDRIASVFYTSSSFTFDINTTDGQAHQLAIYCLDLDYGGRTEKISISDPTTGSVLNSQNLANFTGGVYAVWSVQGHVSVQVTYTGGLNAVVSGIFFDVGGASPALPTVSISSPAAGSVSGTVPVSATASSSVGIANVQFKVDGASIGAAVAISPFTTQWNTANAANGTHTLTAVATDNVGQTTTSGSVTVSVSNSAQSPPSTFVKFDSTTQGTWKGVYGGDGYVIANDSTNLPSYAALTPSGASLYTWYPSTADPRALLKGAPATDRIASTYYSTASFSFDLNLTDGQYHQVALYALDLDTTTRTQTISIINANTNAVLDNETLANFHNGVYAIWNLQGHVKVQVTCTGGLNGVVSGIFFGGTGTVQTTPPPPSVGITSPTAGSTVANSVSVTATATSTAGIASLQFLLDGSNLGSLQNGSGPSFSTTWASTAVSNGSHSLAATATDSLGQQTTSVPVAVNVANTVVTSGATATFAKFDTTTFGTWKGVYGADGYIIANDSNVPPSYGTFAASGVTTYTWAPSSTDQRSLLKGASTTDRVASAYYSSSIFTFDVNLTAGAHQIALYCLDLDSTVRAQTIAILDATTNAVLDTENVTNFHNGIYAIWNIQGHVLIRVTNTGSSNAVVSGLFFGTGGGGSSSGPGAPTVSISSPLANATVSGSVTITATASAPAGMSSVQFQIDGANFGSPVAGTGPTFTTTWTATAGSHTITAIATDTLGQHTTSAVIPVTVPAQGSSKSTFIGFDLTTQGNWKGVYGQNAYYIANDSASPASYGTITPVGASLYTWVNSTGDPRALLKGSSTTDRIASTYYAGSSFNFDVNLTDGQLHEVALYLFDFDGQGRSESISILDAVSNAVLDTETISNFTNGIYATWNVQGHVLIQINFLAGLNPVASGIFLGPPVLPPALKLSTTALTYSAIAGAASPAPQNIVISNSAGGMLNWTATNTQSWLVLSASAGTAPATVSVSANTTGLAPGVYTATITIAAPNAGGSPQTIGITLNVVTPPPVLSISTSTLVFSGTSGDQTESAESVSISNAVVGALNWTATHTQPWLALSASSGAAPGILSVNVNLTGLNAGTYSDTITISGAGALSSPQTVTVSLAVTASASLVADWTFEPATIINNTVLDTSGDNLYATIFGNVTAVQGKVGQALSFDGVTGYLQTQPTSLPAMIGDLTLAMWIRTTNASRTEAIISKYNLSGSEDGYIVETNSSGYLALQLGGSDIQGNGLIVDGVHRINDGQWHHVAVIIRSGQDVSFYVDGGLSSIYYLTTSQGAFGTPLTLAGAVSTHTSPFTGAIDETRIYSRALSTSEIAALFGSTVTTVAGGQLLYNGISMPNNFPPPTTPTQVLRTPYYINNPPRVIPIDVGRQLFVDDFLVGQTSLVRTQHQPSIYPNPVLTPGSPISDGAFYNPATKQFQMWYYNTNAPNDSQYAYSLDGMNWAEPSIPTALVPNTDIIFSGGMDTVWRDSQETDPTRRYKAFQVDAGALKVYVYFSADGITWSARQPYNINSLSDRTTFFWNPFRGVWVNSDRATTGYAATAFEAASAKRGRFYSESTDLANWTPSNPQNTYWTGADDHDPPYYLNNPGGQTPELYTLDCGAYESVLVGLFSWFYPGVGYNSYTLPGPILVELGAGFSRDGFSWVRPTRGSGPTGAFIPASNTPGTWNAYNTQSVGGGFLVVGNEIWFYFSGRTLQKPLDGNFSTGLATLRRDGFYSMDAGSTQGTLTTRPLKFSGGHFFVNVNDPNGQLLVEVLDSNGNIIPGFAAANSTPITANTTLQEVTWSGANVASLAGQTVQFKFYLTGGSLYSFWVTPSAQGASYGYIGAGGPGFTGVTDTIGSAAYLPGQH